MELHERLKYCKQTKVYRVCCRQTAANFAIILSLHFTVGLPLIVYLHPVSIVLSRNFNKIHTGTLYESITKNYTTLVCKVLHNKENSSMGFISKTG